MERIVNTNWATKKRQTQNYARATENEINELTINKL